MRKRRNSFIDRCSIGYAFSAHKSRTNEINPAITEICLPFIFVDLLFYNWLGRSRGDGKLRPKKIALRIFTFHYRAFAVWTSIKFVQ